VSRRAWYAGDTELGVCHKVMFGTVTYPAHLSFAACSLLDRLLDRCPETRWPACPGGVGAVKAHPFFAGVDWDALGAGAAAAPPELLARMQAAEGTAAEGGAEAGKAWPVALGAAPPAWLAGF
jgi:hypothetical protein